MPKGADPLRIIVLGYIVRGPLGGMAWHYLQYVMGLASMGHDVYFIEDSDEYASCYDPVRDVMDVDPECGLRFAEESFRRVGLADRWAYFDAHASRWRGPRAGNAVDLCRSADLLLNVSGVNPLRSWCDPIDVRVFVDTDPAFTQIRHLTHTAARERASQHNAFFSFGENFGQAACTIPDDGFAWRPTRQPVVLDAWPVTPGPPSGKFTTVMQWESYPPQQYDGRAFGMKSASFEPYAHLPSETEQHLELALGGAAAPRDELTRSGWTVIDSRHPTRDPWTYQNYLQESKAEFAVAKQGYVASRSGWFSERSAAYLASGRPVIVQDTGFSDALGVSAGVVTFSRPKEVVAAIDDIGRRYAYHCKSARAFVERHFQAEKVLGELIECAFEQAASTSSERDTKLATPPSRVTG